MTAEQRQPVLFLGHGNPLNALGGNRYSDAWRAIGADLAGVRAILVISAHWYGPGTAVTAMEQPRTIHDFGGFPEALYRIQYPAPGSPEIAQHVATLLAPEPVQLDQSWGLDHGAWSVLRHLRPAADVPVLQLRMDSTLGPERLVALARRLRPLRDEGVLVVGSGNVVHNLQLYAWDRPDMGPQEWALRFEEVVRRELLERDPLRLVAQETFGADARLSVPTPEHYLPLLYVAALGEPGDPVSFPVEGFEGGALSMLSVRFG